MGHIASALSTKVIFTNDNPRTENPETILQEIEKAQWEDKIKKNQINTGDYSQAKLKI